MISFSERIDRALNTLTEAKKAKVIKKQPLGIEMPHMRPMNQPGEVTTEPTPSNLTEDLEAFLNDTEEEEPETEPEELPFPDMDDPEGSKPLPSVLDALEKERSEKAAAGALPDPLPPEDGMEEQTENEPKDTTDKKSESLTVSAGIIKDLEKILGHGSESDWIKKGHDLGLEDRDVKLITIPSEEGDITLMQLWKTLGETLETVKEGVVQINDAVNKHLSAHEREPIPTPPASIENGGVPEEPSDIDKIAADIPDLDLEI